ncbi:lactonase family protein [Halalkalibacter krulwichiae]|uniref:6-phosphogluconolactonase n=1 Tax=Halalkalibacter krulwichiae TaxID=199441 RepID=A0A1X9MEE8_9BACI|nr:lactonase family protein [Halalkalibacter krulwichiae]ARK31817.1 6-phosphogluconolactonase [Halalkalibacter krulwichiae]
MTKTTAYVGTYTKGDSKGIYRFTLHPSTGEMGEVELAAELDNPTYLAISNSKKHLYSVIKSGENGGVVAYSLKESGQLEYVNKHVSPGSPPCHVSVDSSDQFVYSANYHLGTAISYQITKNGELSSPVSIMEHKGNGPHERQEKSHVHYAGLTPDEKLLCVVDLGTDKMALYHSNAGQLSLHNEITFRPGTGPRHIQFHPNGKFAYVNGELSSEVIAFAYHSETSTFTELQYISSLPADFEGESIGGALKVSPDGQFLYASNRGDDSIAVFKIDLDTGKLTLVDHTPTGGEFPRDFTIDPSASYLLAANQDSGNIVQFSIDQATGKLTKTGVEIHVPHPVCLAFL